MKWFSNRKISFRLFTSCAVAILIAAAVGLAGIQMIYGINDVDRGMYSGATDPAVKLGGITGDFLQSRALLRDAILTGDPKAAKSLFSQQQTLLDTANADLNRLLPVLPGDAKSVLEGIDQKFDDYSNCIAATKKLALDSANPDAMAKAAASLKNPDMNYAEKAITNTLEDLKGKLTAHAAAALESNRRTAESALLVVAGILAVGILLSILVNAYTARSITKPLNRLVKAADGLARGESGVSSGISSRDEVGKLASSLDRVASSIGLMIADANAVLADAQEGRLDARADAGRHSGEYRRIIEGFNSAMEAVVAPVREFIEVLSRLCVNDLTVKVAGDYRGDMKVMADYVNETVDRTIGTQEVFLALSRGDMSELEAYEKIGRRSENDLMIPAVVKTMHTLNDLAADAYALSEQAAEGNLGVRGDDSRYEGRYGQVIGGINNLIGAIVAPMADAMDVLKQMSENDFTGAMGSSYKGAYLEFSSAVNSLLTTMNHTLHGIAATAGQVTAGTRQVASGSQALSQGAVEQAAAIEQMTASLAVIAGQARRNAQNAGRASGLARSAREDALAGNERMQELQRAMDGISEASANISGIIRVIDDIAFQTNLLALNAAVEAARAGQYGKGFAVVADEVRSLAQRSAAAAKETAELIEDSIRKVRGGTEIAANAAEALDRIVNGAAETAELVGGIARESEEQAAAVEQASRGIGQVSQVTQANSATAEESSAAGSELSGRAQELSEMVGRFQLRNRLASGKY